MRESDDPAEIETILGELGIEWVLVHADYSLEPYHDFTQSGVYESMDGLELVKNEAGDRLYRVQEPTMVAGVTEDEGVLWFRLAGLGLWLVAVGYKGWEGVVERGLRWGAVE